MSSSAYDDVVQVAVLSSSRETIYYYIHIYFRFAHYNMFHHFDGHAFVKHNGAAAALNVECNEWEGLPSRISPRYTAASLALDDYLYICRLCDQYIYIITHTYISD